MIDAFDGIEDHVTRIVRGHLKDLAEAQVITLEQITFDEAALQRDDYWTYSRLRHWGEHSPLRRHAEAALVHLTERDGNLDRVILQGRSFEMKRPESQAIYVDLKFHDFSRFADLVDYFNVVEWIELVRPTTKKGPIIALRINIIDTERLQKFFDIMRAAEGKRMSAIMQRVFAPLVEQENQLADAVSENDSPSLPA